MHKHMSPHGDYDHLGEAKKIIENFEVKRIIINNNERNHYEEELQKIHKKVQISYPGKEIQCGDIHLIELNDNLQEENDSSQIYFGVYNDITMLFTGDASKKSEEFILKEYELPHINILKVGHHGSKTSTGEEVLKKINPDIALISAGKDNKFNHPNPETLNALKKYQVRVYRTDLDGSIKIKLNNNDYKIRTCQP